MYIYIYIQVYIILNVYIYNVYIYLYTARTGVLPGEVDFNCAGPVFFVCWCVGEMATWLTRFVPKHKTLNLKS